jgi:DNA-binding transcriptional regulator YdaS (Cro superfamily)
MSIYNVDPILESIKILGGVRQMAIKISVSYQSVLDWKNKRRTPTPVNCLKIEKATEGKIKAEDILPDYKWSELR